MMGKSPKIGYHCSHEQFAPRALCDFAQQAEKAGFQAALSSDHLSPWSVRQGQSGMPWPWLGAALQATGDLPFSSLAIPGAARYHPVIVAQAFATLAGLFPGRTPWIAAGSGEALNECMVQPDWPGKKIRDAHMKAAVEIIRRLWRGEILTIPDGPFPLKNARLWSLPPALPKIYGAAISAETAGWMGGWADGLLTVADDLEKTKEVVRAFREGGGKEKPLALQLQISWADDDATALENAFDQWRHTACPSLRGAEIKTPEACDKISESVQLQDMHKAMLVSGDAEIHVDHIRHYADLGFDEIYLHNAGRNQKEFIECFGQNVLPRI